MSNALIPNLLDHWPSIILAVIWLSLIAVFLHSLLSKSKSLKQAGISGLLLVIFHYCLFVFKFQSY
jgi:hypothetical protein